MNVSMRYVRPEKHRLSGLEIEMIQEVGDKTTDVARKLLVQPHCECFCLLHGIFAAAITLINSALQCLHALGHRVGIGTHETLEERLHYFLIRLFPCICEKAIRVFLLVGERRARQQAA